MNSFYPAKKDEDLNTESNNTELNNKLNNLSNNFTPTYILLTFTIIIIFYLFYLLRGQHNDRLLEGFWIASDEFNINSDISSMMLYVGEADGGVVSVSRECYVVITDDIANESFTMSYWKPLLGTGVTYAITANFKFDEDAVEVLPSGMSIEVDVESGKMTLTHEEQVYGILYKKSGLAE